jgi:hypothetical protein
MRFKNNSFKKLLVIIVVNIILKLFIARRLNLEIGSYLVLLIDTLNIFLIFLGGKSIFNSQIGFWSAFLYAISPWTLYYSLLGSKQIVLLFFLLILIFGYFNLGKKTWILILGAIPILALSFKGNDNLFTDIGLINSLNQLQGILRSSGYPLIGRLVENKYSYLGRHLVFNVLKQFAPGIYFTDYAKLAGFSLNPPIYAGFIFFFFYGLIDKIEVIVKNVKQVLFVVLLTLPSVLSLFSPDLAKLLLISPFIFWLIALGFDKYRKTTDKKIRWAGNLFLSLALAQFLTLYLHE